MPQFPDFDLYATLHLRQDASAADVRGHYVKIMRSNNADRPEFIARIKKQFPAEPDESGSDYDQRIAEIAKRSVQRFNVAYDILSDPVQRRAYDRHIALTAGGQDTPCARPAGTPAATPVSPPTSKPKARSKPKTSPKPKPKPDNGHFFKRTGQQSRRKRHLQAESTTSPDKYSIWK